MILRNITLFFLLVFIMLNYSCKQNNPPAPDAIKATLTDYTGFDGCSWVIKLQNNEVIEPVNLGEFNIELKEGKKIWIKFTVADNMASICMVGPIVKLEGVWER